MRLDKSVGSRDCWIVEGLIAHFNMVTVPYKMVGLKKMSDYRGVRLERFTEYNQSMQNSFMTLISHNVCISPGKQATGQVCLDSGIDHMPNEFLADETCSHVPSWSLIQPPSCKQGM